MSQTGMYVSPIFGSSFRFICTENGTGTGLFAQNNNDFGHPALIWSVKCMLLLIFSVWVWIHHTGACKPALQSELRTESNFFVLLFIRHCTMYPPLCVRQSTRAITLHSTDWRIFTHIYFDIHYTAHRDGEKDLYKDCQSNSNDTYSRLQRTLQSAFTKQYRSSLHGFRTPLFVYIIHIYITLHRIFLPPYRIFLTCHISSI